MRHSVRDKSWSPENKEWFADNGLAINEIRPNDSFNNIYLGR